MKRYSTVLNAYDHICFIEDSDGEWVRYDDAQAELAALRARCTRQDGDPTVDEVQDIMEIFNAESVTGRVFRALLRTWWETLTLRDAYDRAGEIHDAAEAERQDAREAEAREWMTHKGAEQTCGRGGEET